MGGGIAGLAAAHELNQRAVRFVLIEGSERLGGVIRTERVGDFTIDLGPDSLLVQKPAAIELCVELGLGDRLISTRPPRTAFILKRGRLHPLPEASVLGIPTRMMPLVTTGLFSPLGKARMAMDLVVPARRDDPEIDESIGQFMRRRFGKEAVTYLAEPLFAGIHSGDVERLSMRALFPRMLDAERRHGSLIRAFRRMPRSPAGADGAFRSLPGGLEEMVRALVATLPAGALRTGAVATSVEGPRPFTVTLESGEAIRADQVIIATPAFVAATLLDRLDPELASLCRRIPYASTATVALAYPRTAVRHPLEGSGFVVPRAEPGRRLLAASWVSSKWPGRAPANSALLRVFFGGARDPQITNESDATLERLAHDELASTLGIDGDPTVVRLQRWPAANAQHEVGHLRIVDAIERRLAAQPGLHVTGGGFRGVGIPDCVTDGRSVAVTAAEGEGAS